MAKPVGRRGKFCQFTAIDDCARQQILKIYPRNSQKTAIQFVDYVLSQLPFAVETIQIDNGAECQSGFRWHVPDKGINHCVYIKPRTSRLNGKVEHSRRIAAEEFYWLLDGVYTFSTPNSKSGRTITTTTGPTAGSTSRPV
ncbi:hypothetical protein AB0B25_25940 [Nocardia sp. NPDC049190]|uniref:hypothetical protein n=1 Tax=Nocardia sp. NPDC049190 TaxID=3155650 RepID=UPI0033C253B8